MSINDLVKSLRKGAIGVLTAASLAASGCAASPNFGIEGLGVTREYEADIDGKQQICFRAESGTSAQNAAQRSGMGFSEALKAALGEKTSQYPFAQVVNERERGFDKDKGVYFSVTCGPIQMYQ